MVRPDPMPSTPVTITTATVGLQGILGVPAEARGIVLFAHGSGSSRLSPRNAFVAAALHEVEVATLLLDLLTEDEATGPVIGMNESALARLRCEKRLVVVPGAGHLFEEPGTLEVVVELANEWYRSHLQPLAG